jgi:ferredoxin
MAKFMIKIDKKACQAFGACVELCSKFLHLSNVDGKTSFRVDGADKTVEEDVVVIESLVLADLECLQEAAEACPFNAIHIVNLQTREKLI